MNQNTINALVQKGLFSEIDVHFAKFIADFSAGKDPEVFLAAALVSRATGSGDICLDLAAVAETRLTEKQAGAAEVVGPPLDLWRRQLMSSPAVGNPGDPCPPAILMIPRTQSKNGHQQKDNMLAHVLAACTPVQNCLSND